MDESLRVCDVEKYYGTKNNITKAVNQVSFTVEKGEFTGIMGPSGSGKTTLLNLLSTIDWVTAGHIYYGDTDITELDEDALSDFRKENLGFVFQDFNLLDTLTIKENIILAMSLHGKKKKETDEKVNRILKTLGIEEIRDKFPDQVSGGQKQRCACARALINEPRLILADASLTGIGPCRIDTHLDFVRDRLRRSSGRLHRASRVLGEIVERRACLQPTGVHHAENHRDNVLSVSRTVGAILQCHCQRQRLSVA